MTTDPIAAARALIEPLREHREQQTVAGGSWWEVPEICAQAADAIATLADALEAERAKSQRLRKAEKNAVDTLDAWFDRRELAHEAIDQAVIDAAGGYLRTSRVGGMSQSESDLVLGVISDMARLSLFADLFARASLDKMLAEARLEGRRTGRNAAAKMVDGIAKHHMTDPDDTASVLMIAAEIRALPEPKEASHD